ncbi:MAG TPA: hypothetical protein PLG94_10565 [Smithellaceae bacterium]|jgi:energy-coupling factor transporter ATP-binding protein EcfA2|nr:hypothetical protein [Smithellaceae bacterium]HRW98100.1 hypothetical protein [Cyclobacteriaceae bacterium]
MNIEIKNCKNIDAASISIAEGKLNIKFAPNGTGKSTIARAITLGISENSDLGELMPFKLRKDNPENKQPEVNGLNSIQQVMCFNEDYVSQFVFKPEELLSNSFEITDDKGDAYQVLSNLLHKGNDRIRGIDNREPKDVQGNYPEMDQTKFDGGCTEISSHLAGFSYGELLGRVCNVTEMRNVYAACTNGYEKLQVCRLIDHEENDAVIEKFIKQTYHIENEFICQLDPAKFDTIPEYVVAECDKIVAGLSQ